MGRKKLLITFGFVIGLASFLFLLADSTLSYSDNADFCLTCHSMEFAYDTWQQSNHKQFKCTECHAPYSYLPKVVFKTKSGLRDLYATTTGQIPQVIKATQETKDIIAANCLRCHESTFKKIDMGAGQFCTKCHRNLVHEKIKR